MINNYKTQVNRYISIKIDWNRGAEKTSDNYIELNSFNSKISF